MTRCAEALHKWKEVIKTKGDVCDIKRTTQLKFDIEAYIELVSSMLDRVPSEDAFYCNFPERAAHVIMKEKDGFIREAAYEIVIDRVAHGQRISTSEARRILHSLKMHDAPPLEGKYTVVYADPPWKYDNTGFSSSADAHYPQMTVEELKDLPIADIAGEPCVLMLWATSPLLPEALEVMGAWGFEYKANRVWRKPSAPMMGWWVRTKHELLLIGTANGLAHPTDMVDSIIKAPVTEHSEKPEVVYEDIEHCYPGSKIELFARKARDGWTSWGNEGV